MRKIIFAVMLGASVMAQAGEIKIAAAADLKFAMDDIVKAYELAQPGDKVSTTFGASGKFATQIKEGAPFDLFFSADADTADAVVKAGKAMGTSFPYAQGHLVVWVRNESKIKLDGAFKCLLSADVKKVAVANALHAPYGKIAEAALKKAEVFEQVKNKLVVGENISQTAQFIESGAAEVGVIAKSLAMSPTLKKEGRFVDVESSLYTPLLQSGVILKGGNFDTAQRFKDYFMGAEAKKILASYGLSL